MKSVSIRKIIVFGASGDVVSRLFLPAIVRLRESGQLPKDLVIQGISRKLWNTKQFRSHVSDQFTELELSFQQSAGESVLTSLTYQTADPTDTQALAKAIGKLKEPVVIYVALPPSVFLPTINSLKEIRLPEGSRIILEKPFGENLETAKKLNQILQQSFPEESIFRIDHFLGKQLVQNILGFRFANRIFEPVWNREHVKRVEIIWDETLGLEGRAGYYDHAGALMDMIQNHLLQLLSLVGMEPPLAINERDLRDRKVDVLRSVRSLSLEEIKRQTVRARYGAGQIGKRMIPRYVDEEGVQPDRNTETLAEVTFWIDNWRWADVPFFLRSGKALANKREEISLHFRSVPHQAFCQPSKPDQNILRLQFSPDRMSLRININGSQDRFDLEQVDLEVQLGPECLKAYGSLLIDVLNGDPTFFVRADEAEESWRIVQPILDAWKGGIVPLQEYPAGSTGL